MTDFQDCVSPEGHDWTRTTQVTREGAAGVKCVRSGCGKLGFEILSKTCPRCHDEVPPDKFKGSVCDWCAEELEKLEVAQNSSHTKEGSLL